MTKERSRGHDRRLSKPTSSSSRALEVEGEERIENRSRAENVFFFFFFFFRSKKSGSEKVEVKKKVEKVERER